MTNWDSLTSQQKLSLGIIVVIGVFGFLLLPFFIRKGIALPFVRRGSVQFKTAEEVERERIDGLRVLDTDKDGLNDYDEQYVFRTSAYVADTDSDGIDDGAEVAQETDPNCPKGKSCRGQVAAGGGAPTAPVAGTGGQQAETDEARIMAAIRKRFGDPAALTPESIAVSLERLSPTDLRQFLGELGIPPAALQRADDATLKQLVKETLNEIAAQQAAATEQTP